MKNLKWAFLPLLFSVMLFFYRASIINVFVRRCLVILCLGTILWTIYTELKEPVLNGKMIFTITLIGVISFLFVIVTLSNIGW
ncbi:hypothetical protein BIV60_16860 [Bacillus sp. MUM 116]|nr:hypothetical protein BIV60_16860 [Bacillus sp. MUM 116]